jgi:hypothetical protein
LYTASDDDIAAGSVVLTLTAWDEDGNSDSDDMILSFEPLPAVPENVEGPEEVCGGAAEVYSCDPINNAASAEWEITPEIAGTITAVTDNEITILWSEDFSGVATLKVRGMNDCGYGDYSEGLVVEVFDCTGMVETGLANILVYPNPVNDHLNINFGEIIIDQVEISLTNILGSVVFTEVYTSEQAGISLDTKNLVDGIYFLKIADQSNTVTRKVIIQH